MFNSHDRKKLYEVLSLVEKLVPDHRRIGPVLGILGFWPSDRAVLYRVLRLLEDRLSDIRELSVKVDKPIPSKELEKDE